MTPGRPSPAPTIAGPIGPDDVRIERLADSGVVVSKTVSEVRRRRSTIVVAGVCAALGVAVCVVFALHRHGLIGGLTAAVVAALVLSLLPRLLWQFMMGTRTCVIRAGRPGLTIDITTWRGRTARHVAADDIGDIVLDCSGGVDPRHTMFRTCLIITPMTGRAIHCLHNVSGDRLAAATNALRAAVGLPARSWP